MGTGDKARYAGTVLVGEVEELTINAVIMSDVDMPAFSPTIIWVEPGQRLTLTFHDLDGHDDQATPAHDFTIEALELAKGIPKGGTTTVELTMPESGTLQFICRPHWATYRMGGEFRVQ
jgi:plastocyanin